MPSPIFHPDLRLARLLPRSVVHPRTIRTIRRLTDRAGRARPAGGTIERVDETVTVRVFRPDTSGQPGPALLFIHGGGYVIGNAAMGDRFCRAAARRLGIVAASVEYRLAPEHPFPAPLDDCYAALRWLAGQPGVDPDRIAIVGESAGGGLAAALALLARDRGEVRPVLQLLSYPMLDDRTAADTSLDATRMRMWSPRSNRFGWASYLGGLAGDEILPLASPGRGDDFTGLPPAWIGVGTNDLFHAENVAYAERLRAAGVSCELYEVDGAYHGFDLVEARTGVGRAYREARFTALSAALGDGDRLPSS
ncbi:alpha/beta hydrolase [Nocardia flavorosea]|uniref:Alpha/beta hydrolase n=1 Tax=Nocardia flavorosea TaxID=53429 RepID=A0A846YKG1_9NOCA|nr:alpha/beta hydrolase [Nocardia flavorosea]NKY58130.1 alpha/beta hydrolase [Nocardia flavorosea]